ncbi:hypothetical protein [Streptomyces sp. NPDC057580]|uniref:hypothetical protein n=1 Tax=Streptomyces sp. NPDC057580 TaxID=3346173 RepID=UPI0036C43C8E
MPGRSGAPKTCITRVRCAACRLRTVLADAEPDTMRFRLYHLPARLTDRARRRWLHVDATWPWVDTFTTCRQRFTALAAVT